MQFSQLSCYKLLDREVAEERRRYTDLFEQNNAHFSVQVGKALTLVLQVGFFQKQKLYWECGVCKECATLGA